MPGLKRRRDTVREDEGEEEIIDVESAQSELRQDTRKKPRLSDEREDLYDDEDDEDSDASTDEDLENLQASQFREKQRKRERKQNQPADNGIIESVTCENFMCHGFLKVPIGPLINFVIGHNGSGKSAVLTALTICLGGKASSTNRAGNLKAFIKEGQEQCTLTIQLKNGGDTGYQQEVYGDSIFIERHFNKAGTSGFKLKSSTGKTISTRKADLEEITDYYSLQMDNPMTVLTQDMARQFLSQSTPHEKYRFFIKGVQLEQLAQDYQLIEESIDYMETTFIDKKAAVNDLGKAMQHAEELYKMSEKQGNIRRKIRALGVQIAWSQVGDQEHFLNTYDKDIGKAKQEIANIEAKVAKVSEQFREADDAHEAAKTTIQALNSECEPIIAEKEAVKEKFDAVKAEALAVQVEQRAIVDTLKNHDSRIEKLEKDIKEEYRRLEEANGGSHAKRLAELDARKGDVHEAKQRFEDHNGGLRALEEGKRRAAEASVDVQRLRKSKANELESCQDDLRTLSQDSGKQRSGYPQNMTQLKNAIRQDNGFRQKPVGPVGDYVHLLKPVWSSTLEQVFGGVLAAFIVTSKVDQARLTDLKNRVGCDCTIMIANNNLFDYSHNEPDPDLETVLRILEIDNPLILRQLIINQAIEQTILIEDNQEAVQKMDRGRLRNVKQCYALTDKGAQRLTYGFGGNLQSTAVGRYRGIPRMKTDIEIQIRLQQEKIKHLEREWNELGKRCRDSQNAEKACNEAIFRHNRRSRELKAAVENAEAVVDQLQDAIDRDSIEEGRLDELKKSLEETQREKALHEGSYEDSVLAKDKHKAEMNKFRVVMKEIDERLKEAESKVRKAEARLPKLVNQRQLALQDKNSTIQALQDVNEDKAQLERDRAEKVPVVAEWAEKAAKIGPRVDISPGETSDSLYQKAEKLTEDVKKFEKRLGGSQQKITEDYAQAKQTYEDATVQLVEEEKLAQLMKTSVIHRRFRWGQFKKFITARAKLMFQYLLAVRGYRGKLRVDYRSRAIELRVQPDETQMSGGRQTKTLSGGEKSFSTICLLLALWDAMGTPVRCLDEFDVFMDSVNRQIAMKMLVDTARRSEGRQFIFITPQSMGNLDSEQDIKIIRMRDPERNQTTIEFSRG
ncbi:Structural maintenance of chromosomes protein 6 [Trapelia coarctata]|nr:Structural maintenance of chromosomes protein 6 [Trapelia coarctata]